MYASYTICATSTTFARYHSYDTLNHKIGNSIIWCTYPHMISTQLRDSALIYDKKMGNKSSVLP